MSERRMIEAAVAAGTVKRRLMEGLEDPDFGPYDDPPDQEADE